MIVCGFSRMTLAPRVLHKTHLIGDLGCAEILCLECKGSGWWDFMEPEIPGMLCVDCKGTGLVYVGA